VARLSRLLRVLVPVAASQRLSMHQRREIGMPGGSPLPVA
jgi:hypothetical protein